MHTLTDTEDPQDCPVCVAMGDVCPFHLGYEHGWSDAADTVGAFVELAGSARPKTEASG